MNEALKGIVCVSGHVGGKKKGCFMRRGFEFDDETFVGSLVRPEERDGDNVKTRGANITRDFAVFGRRMKTPSPSEAQSCCLLVRHSSFLSARCQTGD